MHALFAAVDPLCRRPSIAAIGGFRPEPGLRSWFGGHFWLPPDFVWPEADGEPMLAVLQVVVAEVPVIPAGFADVAVLHVFMANALPKTNARNGDGFFVATHSDPTILAPAAARAQMRRPFQIRWVEGKAEGPVWQELGDYVLSGLQGAFVEQVPGSFRQYYDRYRQHPGTKVGGWASYIQDVPDPPGEFVFQISTEDRPQFFVGDGGNLYFFRDQGGIWWCAWDCY